MPIHCIVFLFLWRTAISRLAILLFVKFRLLIPRMDGCFWNWCWVECVVLPSWVWLRPLVLQSWVWLRPWVGTFSNLWLGTIVLHYYKHHNSLFKCHLDFNSLSIHWWWYLLLIIPLYSLFSAMSSKITTIHTQSSLIVHHFKISFHTSTKLYNQQVSNILLFNMTQTFGGSWVRILLKTKQRSTDILSLTST